MSLKPHKDNILFRFLDEINTRGEFVRAKSHGGLYLVGGFDNSAKQPRWCKAVSVGPDVKHVKEGDWFLLPALRWTERCEFEEENYWKTSENEVVCRKAPHVNATLHALNNFVLFNRAEENVHKTTSGLFVVGNETDNTPKGTAFAAGPDADKHVASGVIYYNGAHFYNDVEDHVETPFSFVRDEEIFCYEVTE